ncbi:cysteine desulfurase family protein [Turneriella parva]|uniref:Aminotransferase class V n=1 Tax=Turneriella parva (strain ATCC BAA-1111 / DSM 21527 / NCTC 11395 / H) TaxID=869212 RepID=I4B0N6_TURPD|nr:aminotransferase class V-fold PLP-dependent enzyme [Turneriella parva]AFM10843.1 aminotransferase class V [Turneriella parva DSM 21527]
MKAKVYLDFNSTHPPDHEALGEARAFYFEHFANSSGLSLESQLVNQKIEWAREQIAQIFTVQPKQIIFTGSATESNNLLLREFYRRRGERRLRVICSPFEHPSIAEPLKRFPEADITFMKASRDGAIEPVSPQSAADLAVLMAIQNESGLVLPLEDFAQQFFSQSIPVLADASQLIPKLCPDGPTCLQPRFIRYLTDRGCYVTATGHKVGAGFGAGLIITPPENVLSDNEPLLAGGNQEHGLRAGSHNVEAIIALALALGRRIAETSFTKWKAHTQRFEGYLLSAFSGLQGAEIIGANMQRAPGTTLLLLPGVPIDFLIMALDKAGITVSTGTSCKSRSRTASAALLAMGYSESEALGVVRLSYDQNLSDETMQTVASTLATAANRLSKL